MLVQFEDYDDGPLIPVDAASMWRYEIFHVDGALVERYNRALEECKALREKVVQIQRTHAAHRNQVSKEWAQEKLAAFERDGEVKWTTWQGKAARLYTAEKGKSVFLMSDVTDTVPCWLGYRSVNDLVLSGLTVWTYRDMESEWMQKLIAPPEGSQEGLR